MLWFKSKVKKAVSRVEKKEAELSNYCAFCRYTYKVYGGNSVMYRAAMRKKHLIEAEIEELKVCQRLVVNEESMIKHPYKFGILE